MNRSAISFIVPIFFSCFFSWSNSDCDAHYYVDYSDKNGSTYIMSMVPLDSGGGVNSNVDVHGPEKSADFFQKQFVFKPSRMDCWSYENNRKLKNSSPSQWANLIAEETEINKHPLNWPADCQMLLFSEVELYKYNGFRVLLKSLSVYDECIVAMDKLRRNKPAVKKRLEKYNATDHWFGNKTVDAFITEELPSAKRRLEQKERQEIQKRQQEEQEALKRIEQEKKDSQKNVRDIFVQKKDEIAAYKEEIVKQSSSNIIQKRSAAIEKAISENFRITIQRYNLTNQASNLLKRYNIDSKIFDECVGNAIQQEAHSEFIEVLNNGAELYSEKDGLPDAHLSEAWFGTLGSFSFVGTRVNKVGHYDIAHRISDVCHGICDAIKIFMSSEVWYGPTTDDHGFNREDLFGLQEPKNLDYSLENLALYPPEYYDWTIARVKGGASKAFIRPARNVAKLAHLIKHHPELVAEALYNTDMFIFETIRLLSNATLSSDCWNQIIQHNDEWEVSDSVLTMAKAFHDLPRDEKIEEGLALVMQALSAKMAGKLVGAVLVEAELLGETIAIKFSEVAIDAGISGGGGITVTTPLTAGVPISVGVDKAVELGAGAALAIPKVACLMDGGPESGGGGQKSVRINSIDDMPEEGRIINGRAYSGHALERMAKNTHEIRQEIRRRAMRRGYRLGTDRLEKYIDPRNISSATVEEIILVGKKVRDRIPNRWNHIARGFKVVTDKNGKVITIFKLR